MTVANYSDFRKNMKERLDSVVNDADTLIIHRPGGKDVVVISLDEYNSIRETNYLLSSPANRKHLLEGIKEFDQGKGIKVKKDKLWK